MRVNVRLARRSDDLLLRRLLRQHPVGERPSIAYEREPDFFLGSRGRTWVADFGGELEGLVTRSVRPAWINGKPSRVGAVSQLRVDRGSARSLAILREGARKFRESPAGGRAPFYLATLSGRSSRIAGLLASGRLGLPAIRFSDRLSTLSLSPHGKPKALAAGLQGLESQWRQLSSMEFRRFQFGPRLMHELPPQDWVTLQKGGRLVAAAALKDERRSRQLRVASLPRAWRLGRPLINALAPRLLGWPELPAEGQLLQSASAAYFCVKGDDLGLASELMEGLLSLAASRGIKALNLALSERHPLAEGLGRRFGGLKISSDLALLHWDEGRKALAALDGRPAFVDVSDL